MAETDSPIAVSANELFVTARKALLAGNVAAGVAVELAEAVVRLSSFGAGAAQDLVAALNDPDIASEPANWTIRDQTASATGAHALIDGPSVLDLARSGYRVEVEIEWPILLAGLELASDVQPVLIQEELPDHNLRPLRRRLELKAPWPRRLRLVASSGTQQEAPRTPQGLFVDAAAWARLQHLATGLLVPADDTSRADAGSAKPDND